MTTKPHEPGIYFGMSAEEYHSDPSLSSSGIKDLLVSTEQYWRNSTMNPNRREREDEGGAMEFGNAMHCRILEPEVFHQRYAAKLEREDYPDALASGDELAEWLGNHGEKKSGTIEERVTRIGLHCRSNGIEEPVIWRAILQAHESEHDGKTMLSAGGMSRIESTARKVEAHQHASEALSGGMAEVSIFWVDQEYEVAMKARLDYLKPRKITDLKSFSAGYSNRGVEQTIARAISNYRYDVQAVVYCDAVENLKWMAENGGLCVNDEPEPGTVSRLTQPTHPHTFQFVFVESAEHAAIRVVNFAKSLPGIDGNTLYWDRAEKAYRSAVATWAACMEAYGPDRPWSDTPPVTTLQDSDFNLFD